MRSVVHSVLGAALLLTGASAAMAASGTGPVTYSSGQAGATTAAAVTTSAPVVAQPGQTGAAAGTAVTATAPVVDQAQKSRRSGISDNNDPHGGYDPNSSAGARMFFVPQY